MPENQRLSQTMRIDLIPDTPAEPRVKRKSMVITSPSRQRRGKTVKTPETPTKDARYDELLQSIYDAALICDLEGQVVDVNVRAVEFLRYAREALGAMSIFDIISGASEDLVQTLWDNLKEERFTLIQAYCVRQDGSLFPAEIAVNKLDLGKPHLCFFVRDITLRRQAEEMLRTEHNAIQNAFNGIAVAGMDAKLEYVNPAVARMWDVASPEELRNVDLRDLLADRDRSGEIISRVLGEGETWTGEMIAVRKDGSTFEIDLLVVSNRNADGEVAGMVLSTVDISDRKKAESIQRENERHRVMLESLGAACHHLGQPATVLLANLGMIQRHLHRGEEVTLDLVEGSIEAVKTLGDILKKLNTVNEYKTTYYLSGEGSDSDENRILDI